MCAHHLTSQLIALPSDSSDTSMSSVMRYDIINYFLKEPVEIPCDFSAFPMIRKVVLYPTATNSEEHWPLQEPAKVASLLWK